MSDVASQTTDQNLIQQIRRDAAERFQLASDWVEFYREILGVKGLVSKLFPDRRERTEFEQTPAYTEIQQMLARLREKNGQAGEPDEPTRVITVRLPRSLHEALRDEAYNHKTSMNKLCISKLLQMITEDLVPSDFERRDSERSPRAAAADRPSRDVPLAIGGRTERSLTTAPLGVLTGAPLPIHDTLGGGRPF